MNTASPQILGRLAALSDLLRGRILLLLESRELTVTELCAVLQVPQSTVSRHLKTLAEASWVVSRPDGTRRLYRMSPAAGDRELRRLWLLAREGLSVLPGAAQDSRRLASVLAERREGSRAFFAQTAGDWDRVRDELFGARFCPLALLALLERNATYGDLGCGTGAVAEALAPFSRRVIAVDGADPMLVAARHRLARFANVELRRGELEELPVEEDELDAATLVLALHHCADPPAVLAEVARVLRPGGRVLVVDMLPHDRQEYREEMGHVWLGFQEDQLRRWLATAGFGPCAVSPLPPDAAARGPELFAACAALDRT